MKTNLKKHNVEPVKKVLDAFNAGEQRVALAHATGTGKSYATCAIIEQGNFKNVLYLSPSNHINKYFERVVIKNLGNRQAINILATYSFLLHRDLKSLAGKYDLIVLDEYHRLGAEEWGKAVKKVLELNPQSKILGLTATEVRYCDNWKDMSKELNFNVVSRITLVDAIERRILPAPEYIIGFSDFNRIIEELEALVVKCKADKEYLEEIKKMKVDWINSDGLAGIVKYHLPITTSKIVVFSEAIERYDEIVDKMTDLLTAAGLKNLKFLRADSNTKESLGNIEYFSTNNDKNEVKVIISVNMLNEGIHAEGAEACFMFRKTHSANIFLQQLGRIESSLDPESRPVVFDLVNNISNDWELFTEIGLTQRGETIKINRNCIKRVFGEAGISVTSYVEREEEMKESLNRLYYPAHTFEELEQFVQTHNRWPNTRTVSERKLWSWANQQMRLGNLAVLELYKKVTGKQYKKRNVYNIEIFLEFIKTHDRLPLHNKDSERGLYEWMNDQIKLGNKTVIRIHDKYCRVGRYSVKILEAFVLKYGRLPKGQGKTSHERGLWAWMNRQIKEGNQEVINIYNKYYNISIITKYKEDLAMFKEFVRINNRLPNSRIKEERKLYYWMCYHLKKGKQEVIDIYNRFNPDKPWKG